MASSSGRGRQRKGKFSFTATNKDYLIFAPVIVENTIHLYFLFFQGSFVNPFTKRYVSSCQGVPLGGIG